MEEHPPKIVTATSFELVGGDGRPRARLAPTAGGAGVELACFDSAGTCRLQLGLDEGGEAKLAFHDATGHRRLVAAAAADGTPSLALYDRDGHARVELCLVEAADFVGLALSHGRRQSRLLLQLEDGQPMVVLHDRSGRHRLLLKVQHDGRVGLAGFGAQGEARVLVGVDEDGTPRLELYDPKEAGVSTAVVLEDGELKIKLRHN